MSLYVDQKYLNLISNRLPLFKKKKDNTYNCRCIICGDSKKKKSKARGYFFANKSKLFYKCFNCDAAMAFSTFLKDIDQNLYNEYNLENYSDKHFSNNKPTFKFEQPKFKTKSEKKIDEVLIRLSSLDSNHEAIKFVKSRNIPDNKYNQIYYIDNISKISHFNEDYAASIKTKEPRIVFPFYDFDKQLTGLTCRGIRGEALRYITVKIIDDKPLIYGLESIDKHSTVYVVEGPIDSLFLQNSIAIAGTSLKKITKSDFKDIVIIYDNQPRNKQVCDQIEKAIDNQYKVCIWPQNIVEKDINDMVNYNINVQKIVRENIFCGLEAKMKFMGWKRI
tara:strand:- start:1593 stop:2594 length:1002 start_codon:yes stop_codon:yes gene_type:complete